MNKKYILFHKDWRNKKVHVDIVSTKQGIIEYIKKVFRGYNNYHEKWCDVADSEINELFEKTKVEVKEFPIHLYITELNDNGEANSTTGYCDY